jgi:ribonuclease Z
MAKIIFLGTAAAVAKKDRDNTSLLICEENERILIDCPGSLVSKLKKINIDYCSINTIFISHTHPDHIYGLISLIHSRYRLHDEINIYSHPDTLKLIKKIQMLFKLHDTDIYPKLNLKTIKPNLQQPFYNSKNMAVFAFPVKHAKESLGFKFLFKKSKINLVVSGDTAKSQNIITAAKKTDYLIHDCFAPKRFFKKYPSLNNMHTSSTSLGKLARTAGVKMLIPIHFAGEINYPISDLRREIRKGFRGKILIPKDLKSLKLTAGPA